MKWTLCRVVIAVVTFSSAAIVSAQEVPATAPTAPTAPAVPIAPTTQPIAQIQKWFDNLASTEPAAREQARFDLLGLARGDLETLREVVRKNVPLAPSQSAVLRDIVAHVYLTGDKDSDGLNGFLGVMLDPQDSGVQENMQASNTGVYIFDCMPGFTGYRWLRPGDVVSGIFADGELVHTTQKQQLIAYVSHTAPGTPLKLQVLRQGREVEVNLRVDERPRVAEEDPLKVDEWRNQRLKDADDYWTQTFVPIIGSMTRDTRPGGSPSNSGQQA